MLLDIEPDVFESSDHQSVFGLFRLIAEERHEWQPSLAAADSAQTFVRTRVNNVASLTELVEKALKEALSAPGRQRAVNSVTADQLRQIVGDLERPAVVIVEDFESDQCFLLALARAFDRERVLTAASRSWLVFVHAGGADRMPELAWQEQARFSVMQRVAAVLDSDRQDPSECTKTHRYAEQINSYGCDVHVWEGREVENYVPTRVWRRHFPDLDEKINMLLTMRLDQRRVLDLKNGLRAASDADTSGCWADLPREIREEWRTGFKPRRRGMPNPLVPEDLSYLRRTSKSLATRRWRSSGGCWP